MSDQIRSFRNFIKKNETAKGLLLIGIVLLGAVIVWGGIRLAQNTEFPILVVSSGSMCPSDPAPCTLPVGALIVIRGQSPDTIQQGPPCSQPAVGPNAPGGQLGSIIVFRPYVENPDYLVVHRVRQIFGSGSQLAFRTQGDANGACDPWPYPNSAIPASQVVGVYQYTIPIPYLGSSILAIRDFMSTPQGVLVVIALIVALFALEIIEPTKKAAKPPAEPTPLVNDEDSVMPRSES
ncbi:MAG TPA: hypothetical protein VE177_06130 [Candidatus Binatus sp.]|nr:hypothetical protein [Candidatus Binatus sp.]